MAPRWRNSQCQYTVTDLTELQLNSINESNKATIAENTEVAKARQNDPGHNLKDGYRTVVNHTLIVVAYNPSVCPAQYYYAE